LVGASRVLAWFAELRRRKVFRVAAVHLVACAYAVPGMRDESLDALDRAVRNGRGDLGWIENDPDFDGLRAEPRFGAIVDRLRTRAAGEPR